jgi:allophanate hydrolase subunit 2
VPLGALQVPPDGQPIVLMADHQTTGGYPILATVIAADVRLVAQRAAGERLTFKVVGVEEAQRAWLEMQALFAPPRKSFVSSR